MINIRSGIFETNSSSSHAIVINNAGTQVKNYNKLNIVDGVYTISNGLEFGRAPFRMLTTVSTKLRFVIASLASFYINGPEAFMDELINICKKHYPDLKTIKLTANDYYDGYGYIDHQSNGLLDKFLNKHNISIEDFIFDPKYIVIIDGDEYCEFSTLIELNLISDKFETED